MKAKLGIRVISALMIVMVLCSTMAVAYAASGSEAVGGGQWSWKTIHGTYASSAYYHRDVTHRASAQIGTGDIVSDTALAGGTARATVRDVFGGTCRVWWDNEA